MGIIYGLTAAVFWGITDFFISFVARRIGTKQAMFRIETIAFGVIAFLLVIGPNLSTPPVAYLAIMVGLGALNAVGTFLFYRALTIGTVSIVTPIMSGYSIVTALLAFLAGEQLGTTPVIGTILLISGVMVISIKRGKEKSGINGVLEAVGMAFVIGTYFWTLKYMTPQLGILWPVVVMRIVRVMGAFWLKRDEALKPLSKEVWGLVVIAAVLDTLGFIAFNIGATSSYISIVTALASLCTAVTVILALIFFKEKLSLYQWTGVALILLGGTLVSNM